MNSKENIGESRIPLSFAQEGLWVVEKVFGSLHYHIPLIFSVNGVLDLEVLEHACQSILARHISLRTTFKQDIDGQVFQETLDSNSWRLNYSEELIGKEEKDIQDYIDVLKLKPFNLEEDFLLRSWVLKTGSNSFKLVFIMHHIAFDGWSAHIFSHELKAFYNSRLRTIPAPLKELKYSYSDYAISQRQDPFQKKVADKIGYWEKKLDGLSTLDFPTDFLRPSIQSYKGNNYVFEIDPIDTNRIKVLAKEHKVTPYMVLLSIFNVFLYKYTGQEDIAIGTPVANRNSVNEQEIIGFFVNSLVIRNDLSKTLPFIELLNSVKKTVLDAYRHQEVPFDSVVRKLNTPLDNSRSALFQIMFAMQTNVGISSIELGDTILDMDALDYNTSKYDFTFSITGKANKYEVYLEYCTDLFKEETIITISKHFRSLVNTILTNPLLAINDYKLISEEEKDELLVTLNNTGVDYPKDVTILDLFKTQVTSNPESIALVYEDHSLSYGDLDHRSSVLAKELIDKGVKKGDLVPICMDRSMEMIVGILGVLKSGGAYVPIDPMFPE
ncbi:MAG: AMP-binding protein, partial [Flavobacteriaceae bacterium]